MMCREKYVLDNAVKFAEGVDPPGCPDDYGYLKLTDVSDEFGYCLRPCKSCWDIEIPETDEIATEIANLEVIANAGPDEPFGGCGPDGCEIV